MGTAIESGDRIRVVIEGPAFDLLGAYTENALADSFINNGVVIVGDDDSVTVEKIEPPVTVFKPGDVVRARDNPKMIFVVARGGYLDLYNRGVWNKGETEFTSECFELVPLG